MAQLSSLSPLPSLAVVDALRRLGLSIEEVSARRVVLLSGARRVFVPRHRALSAAEIQALLRIAHVDEEAFVQQIERRSSGVHAKVSEAARPASRDRAPRRR